MLKKLIPCLAALGTIAGPAMAAAPFPAGPVTIVVPNAAGGLADNIARPLADALGHELKQPVIVENKGGAGGVVGTGMVARAKPDGYTLLLTLSSISGLPEADRLLGRKPAFQLDQFVPIARITADPNLLVVRADAPWKSVAELVADAKKNPQALNYGSSGVYGAMHIPMEMLKAASGAPITHVPFSGGGPALVSLLAGQVQLAASGPANASTFVRSGKMRPLAHWGTKPLASMPGVPSLKSLGYDVEFTQWSALIAPAATPKPVIDALREAVRKVTAQQGLQQVFLNLGSPIDYMDAPEFAAYWKTDAERVQAAVRRIGKVD
ncbi:tripartite tricarboxylate transporter substrate binding protein [Pigmentiphaga sp. GD03639]|uniref:tripartite tricarboxylate transporter substrate binding protein n=1 Tax=Pigmentiphaga sp. GD03639 TaxID=2975354 RepID=UPI00244A20F9|nr:tripartite tricarboxylate transporter substrate binding protein [Pigmentiphaga sp. GD03639]MDH2235101.1 tripartite tricarboxylate transporter substrate binding protein [Pigmentiphaga sp. GD03639]